jgi:hypothetical protein
MRKRLLSATPDTIESHDQAWIDVSTAALVEVTSEQNDRPIETALLSRETPGWRAAMPGDQTIRLIFDEPQNLRALLSFSRRMTQNARKNSFCGGLQMVDVRSMKLCGSSGISVRPKQLAS